MVPDNAAPKRKQSCLRAPDWVSALTSFNYELGHANVSQIIHFPDCLWYFITETERKVEYRVIILTNIWGRSKPLWLAISRNIGGLRDFLRLNLPVKSNTLAPQTVLSTLQWRSSWSTTGLHEYAGNFKVTTCLPLLSKHSFSSSVNQPEWTVIKGRGFLSEPGCSFLLATGLFT